MRVEDLIAKIANVHITRINTLLENPSNAAEREAFDRFAKELRDDLNESVTDPEIVEMLAQHLITQPVFEAVFEGYSFASRNPVSQAMKAVLEALHEHRLEKEADTLDDFYASVKLRAEGIHNAAGKQKIIAELYDKFFRNAFPRMTDRLGIVYTPIEIVDFIINSIADALSEEFGVSLGNEGVHIIDPFTGTGTFMTRLLQSGHITPDELEHKYRHELHANEIVLLAYYIAAINIEAIYHGLAGGEYRPFEGICLTDSFQLYEKDDLVSGLLADNSERRMRQKSLDLRVIMANPPYSIGQLSENDNNKNVVYPDLDARIAATYAKRSDAKLAKSLYDSYVRAIRWASDRIGKNGVIGFVTNAGFLDTRSFDGLRRCLADEFSSVYIFHLRGNQRTAGELSRKEGGKIFGSGSRAPIAISIFVKNPNASEHGRILFHDIGDYLTREEKLERIAEFGSIGGVFAADAWRTIVPDEHGDWLKQRGADFSEFMPIGDKEDDSGAALFGTYSLGVVTNRDAWCYNSGRAAVASNMTRMIEFYNHEIERFKEQHRALGRNPSKKMVNEFIDTDPTKISWTRALKGRFRKGDRFAFESGCLTTSTYRPFYKQWMYFNRDFNEMVHLMPRLFPPGGENVVIGVPASKSRSGFSVSITDCVPSLHAADMVGSQYFPLYLYVVRDGSAAGQGSLFEARGDTDRGELRRDDAITDQGLAHFAEAYPGETIAKEDLFYYVYGLLHSEEYRERYTDSLGKELPRIPRVASAADFWAFSSAGRKLAEIHLHYESVEPFDALITASKENLSAGDYRVEKMRFGKINRRKDRSKIVYNEHITVAGIPLEAYEYVVNGKSAIEWVMDRQCVQSDTRGNSGIVNDANDWATETMKNPRYPLELLLRIIKVSLETVNIVNALPSLEVFDLR